MTIPDPPQEQPSDEQPSDDTGPAQESGTGHPAVDEVLRTLDGLDERPVEEHVEVFESAHEGLRRVLDEAREPGRDGQAT